MDELLKYWPIIIVLFNAGLFVVVFALTKTFAKREDVAALAVQVAVFEQRLGAVPEHDDLDQIRATLTAVEKSSAIIGAEMTGAHRELKNLAGQVAMLLKHHLDDNK
ncbi:MAG: DUF2730 family protein [Rhodospirillales bacterium]|nr:DUF2730 family protein [Rhodospirillales bacterium]